MRRIFFLLLNDVYSQVEEGCYMIKVDGTPTRKIVVM